MTIFSIGNDAASRSKRAPGQWIASAALYERASPDGFGAFHKSEIDKWWPLIKSANIRVE